MTRCFASNPGHERGRAEPISRTRRFSPLPYSSVSTDPLAEVIVLQTPLMRRTLLLQQHQLRMRRRKVKIAVAGACLAGLMAWFLAIALEPVETRPGEDGDDAVCDESPFHASHGGRSVGDGPAWFTTLGNARAADTR